MRARYAASRMYYARCRIKNRLSLNLSIPEICKCHSIYQPERLKGDIPE